jgi:hypothetical protein
VDCICDAPWKIAACRRGYAGSGLCGRIPGTIPDSGTRVSAGVYLRFNVSPLRESARSQMWPGRRRRNRPETLRQMDRSWKLALESGRFDRPTEGDRPAMLRVHSLRLPDRGATAGWCCRRPFILPERLIVKWQTRRRAGMQKWRMRQDAVSGGRGRPVGALPTTDDDNRDENHGKQNTSL